MWLMIHSGSRHLGNVVARFYNSLALELNTKWHSDIPNKDLAFFPAESAEGKDYIHDRWNKLKKGKTKGMYDLGEAPQAYKDIDTVIEAELDLIKPLVKLRPLGVVKGIVMAFFFLMLTEY